MPLDPSDLKPQNNLPEIIDPSVDELWFNVQENDSGNQKKVAGVNIPWSVQTGEGLWTFSNSTNDADQGTARVWFNSGNQSNTTVVYLSNTDLLGKDWSADLLSAQAGQRITVVHDNTAGFEFELTGPVIDGATYVKLPVSVTVDLDGSIGNNDRCEVKGSATQSTSASAVGEAIRSQLGWAFYSDSAYTSGSPLQLNSGNSYSAQLTINGLGSTTAKVWPSGLNEPWNTTTNKIVPVAEGDAYDIRIEMKAQDGATSTLLDLDLNIGGSVGEIYRESRTIAKGSSVETNVVFSFPLFSGSTFLANGGTFTVSTDSVNMDIWDMNIFIYRKFSAA